MPLLGKRASSQIQPWYKRSLFGAHSVFCSGPGYQRCQILARDREHCRGQMLSEALAPACHQSHTRLLSAVTRNTLALSQMPTLYLNPAGIQNQSRIAHESAGPRAVGVPRVAVIPQAWPVVKDGHSCCLKHGWTGLGAECQRLCPLSCRRGCSSLHGHAAVCVSLSRVLCSPD